MANNRMYLRRKSTGEAVLLAKFYPGAGWSTFHVNLSNELEQRLFDHKSVNAPELDFELEYEHPEGGVGQL